MIDQATFENHTIYRFELTPNSTAYASDKAFNIYGVLIIPILLGIFLMYNVFQLEDEYFMYPFLLMVLILINLYFLYKRTINKTYELKLIISGKTMQIINHKEIYFQENINLLDIKNIKCGRGLQPAISLKHQGSQEIIIGLKTNIKSIETENYHVLIQPDYWIKNNNQSENLMDYLQNRFRRIEQ